MAVHAERPLVRHPLRHQWGDVSEYVVHFTRDRGAIEAADSFVSILGDGHVRARSKFGIGRRYDHCRHSVCLTEAPLHELARIADRRSVFGIGFLKSFAVASGGGPVSYLYGEQAAAAEDLMRRASDDPEDPIWTLAPFMDAPVHGNAFEWEREWRIPRDLPFGPRNIQFLTAPEDDHEPMIEYFVERAEEVGFMNFSNCRLIDLNWDRDQMQEAFLVRR